MGKQKIELNLKVCINPSNIEKQLGDSPGPIYSPPLIKPSSPAYSFTKAQRFKYEKYESQAGTPGPGEFHTSTDIMLPHSPAYSFAGRFPEKRFFSSELNPKGESSPGPKYNTRDAFSKSSKARVSPLISFGVKPPKKRKYQFHTN